MPDPISEFKLTASDRLRYHCYKSAVQDPNEMLPSLEGIYHQVFKCSPKVFREDFCGTYYYACEWVKRNRNRRAIGLDINPRPLAYGRETHFNRLSSSQQQRLKIAQRNVLNSADLRAELITTCNFSFYVFKRRKELLRYCRQAQKALFHKGLFILEMIGGSYFEDAPRTERRVIKYERGKDKGKHWFTYSWNHKNFNPISREGYYSISFNFPDRSAMKDTFVYDWRVWTLPEVRDCMLDAGFDDVQVFWEDTDKKGRDLGTYSPREEASNDLTWICYLVGIKR